MAVTCEYTRRVKKRGKGSDLYPATTKTRKMQNNGHDHNNNVGGGVSNSSMSTNLEYTSNSGTDEAKQLQDSSSIAQQSVYMNPPPTTSAYDNNGYHITAAAAAVAATGAGNSTSPGGSSASDYTKPDQFFDQGLGMGSPKNMITESAFNSPRWINLNTSFPTELFTSGFETKERQSLSYPVLNPIAHQLTFADPQLISDLIEVYFSNTVYGVSPIVRKSSLLSMTNPRPCSPALLFSFLLVSAHATDHPKMKATPSTRENIIQKLTDLVIQNLHPLREISGRGTLDDVIACIHLGIVSSASEFKGESMKWWNMAWSLARMLKLNVENNELDEEQREEQRRTWWLLFLVDRHLALCYNLPLSLNEAECMDLYVPTDESLWVGDEPLMPAEADSSRFKGPPFTVCGTGLFGMYLPFMAILGRIVELHFVTMNPLLENQEETIKTLRQRIRARLDTMEQSIEEFMSDTANPSIYVLTWKEYCRCYIHIFHILSQGFWDPINLMDSMPSLLEDQEFCEECIGHSIQAAKCLERVLTVDPDLRLIPYFFGIQLLLTGITLLCIADHLEKGTSSEVRHSCEIVVRAHEACIVTLNTEYQRQFRAILRGAIQSFVFPELSEGVDQRRSRRREVLALYRWCPGGTGLAI